ncbi:hypothetical protein PG991_012903 [Apiospora marii]|uniref:DUF7726 domain-containing protein n=2 Tax=Apiospora marii TaxID=335849 RepID=A0ABR1RB53_9PEZI
MAPATKGATKPKAGAPVAPGSKKRKSEAPELTLEEEIAAYKQDLNGVYSPEYYVDLHLPSPGTLRGRVNKLFDSGIMTKSEFCRAVGTNTNTLNRFLTQSRTANVSGSSVYAKAWIWFQQREEAGLKMPDVRKRQKKEADAAAATAAAAADELEATQLPSPSLSSPSGTKATTKAKGSAGGSGGGGGGALPDISDIHLDGEEEDKVPIFDTCDEVRHKINAHLRKTPGLTEAEFRRTLFAQLHTSKGKAIQPKQLTDFRTARGSRAGIKSCVYYAAYVYFEKLRLARGQPESEHRQTMEDIYIDGIDRNVHNGTR